MLKDSFQVLEYFHVLEIISKYAESKLGKDYCLSLRPTDDPQEIDERLRLLKELREFLNVKGRVTIGDLVSVNRFLDKANIKGSYLTPDEILAIKRLLEVALKIKRFILSEGKEYVRLCRLVNSIPDLRELLTILGRCISDRGSIKDSASSRLKKIREKKIYYRNRIQKKLEEILNKYGIDEFHISIRDGRYVVGLNSNKRAKIHGIFHGYSHSKATSFMEPAEIVDENNLIAELEIEEKEEELRILATITKEIGRVKKEIEYIQTLIAKIDGLCAEARFCDLLSCIMPEICHENIIDIKDARNPILAYFSIEGKSDCIPIDLCLGKERNILIISGPNRGGKTVALKTLGLLCLMTQTGIHIPAKEGSRLRIFKRIIAEIGDDQDIKAGMSTFSAHIEHLKEIIKYADKDTLVIIDEPGMGTDPLEGAALSMAILDYLIEKGAFVAVSTHLNRLKLYGINNNKVINASVEFDSEKRTPTFKIRYGSAGVSMGFEIAKDMGIPQDILNKAKYYLDNNEFQLNRSIDKLNALVFHLENKKRMLEDIKKEYEEKLKKIDKKKNLILESARIEAESIIKDARRELRLAIDRLKKDKSASPGKIVNKVSNIAKELISRFEPQESKISLQDIQIKDGQKVYHKGLKQKGIILSYDPVKKGVFILFGNMKLWAELKDIEIIKEEAEDQSYYAEMDDKRESDYMPEINIIGYKVDEAIPVIDKAIDKAILNGNPGFKIVHGIGTGKLRKAIRDYLRGIPYVKNIKPAELEAGGDAITIVELS